MTMMISNLQYEKTLKKEEKTWVKFSHIKYRCGENQKEFRYLFYKRVLFELPLLFNIVIVNPTTANRLKCSSRKYPRKVSQFNVSNGFLT